MATDTMAEQQTLILNDRQVKQIIKRMAFQIYERNFEEKNLIIAGISGRGESIADLLAENLREICTLKIQTTTVLVDKESPSESNTRAEIAEPIGQKTIVLVDDVLNTGRTLMYALLPFVKQGAKKIQTAILVDRNHKSFPVSADYIGTLLSTTMKEHINVNIDRKKVNVYLS